VKKKDKSTYKLKELVKQMYPKEFTSNDKTIRNKSSNFARWWKVQHQDKKNGVVVKTQTGCKGTQIEIRISTSTAISRKSSESQEKALA